MRQVRCLPVLVVALALGATLLTTAPASAAELPQGAFWFMASQGNLLGLVNVEQVQKELKLNEEQVGKVKELTQKLWQGASQQFAGLGEITDWEKRRAKMEQVNNQLEQKTRGQLRDVLSQEQRRRLFQIRIQIRGALYALNSKRIATRLKLTEEQTKKAAEIDKTTRKKTADLFTGLENLSQDERFQKMGELFKKLRELADKANQEAVKLLTEEQKKAFQKIQGEKFELQMPRPGQ